MPERIMYKELGTDEYYGQTITINRWGYSIPSKAVVGKILHKKAGQHVK
ncbi:hypothetical protein PUR_00420 [Paenibacillus sp. URB8-2]|nr:hypothetical protein PUR_00420 [Paenibacillus sp. URB8-2]